MFTILSKIDFANLTHFSPGTNQYLSNINKVSCWRKKCHVSGGPVRGQTYNPLITSKRPTPRPCRELSYKNFDSVRVTHKYVHFTLKDTIIWNYLDIILELFETLYYLYHTVVSPFPTLTLKPVTCSLRSSQVFSKLNSADYLIKSVGEKLCLYCTGV